MLREMPEAVRQDLIAFFAIKDEEQEEAIRAAGTS